MAIDSKTSKHICNVIRRQVQSGYPDLYINFTIHNNHDRQKIFKSEEILMLEHDAGGYVKDYMYSNKAAMILKQNKSLFAVLAHHNAPGFLGFFKVSNFFANCFINHENFKDEDNLRNHALNLTWHAISLYQDFKQEKTDNFTFENHIITPNITQKYTYNTNLKADIFSTSLQILQGRKTALDSVAKQRIIETMSAEPRFIAEEFLFPICVDTLDYVFKNNIEQYNNNNKTVLSAAMIAEDVAKTYENSAIEKWRSFCIPAQKMAWLGHDIKTILGAAIYGGENAFTQSIADMIAERMHIKPKMPIQKDYNPFANRDKNKNLHISTCSNLINQILEQEDKDKIYTNLMENIQKQNTTLLKGNPLGWCANAMFKSAEIIKQDNETHNLDDIKNKAKEEFKSEMNSIEWDTLSKLSHSIFEYRRNGKIINIDTISEIARNNDEFSKIYKSLLKANNLKIPIAKKQNITDFISPNAIK